jgi:hypothetical protein
MRGSRDHSSRTAVILPDDNYSARGARGRFDPQAWISGLADHPADVAHQLELVRLHSDEVTEALLAGVEVGPRYPVRASGSSLRWVLPRVFRRPRAVTVLDVRFSTHLAAVLGLAARGDGPAARRIRTGLQELHLPQRAPWWLHDTLESFTNLVQFTAPGTPWHSAAIWPRGLLCLPSMCELHLDGAGLGDHRLATTEWNLPVVTRLSLSGNRLTRVPDAVLGLDTLEVLNLMDNPIREVPAVICDGLPGLRYVDLRRTGVTTLPKCFKARPGLHVQIGG